MQLALWWRIRKVRYCWYQSRFWNYTETVLWIHGSVEFIYNLDVYTVHFVEFYYMAQQMRIIY